MDADAIVVVGGSGMGLHDNSVRALARAGRVVAHGIGLSPGETSAFGFINATPVIAPNKSYMWMAAMDLIWHY